MGLQWQLPEGERSIYRCIIEIGTNILQAIIDKWNNHWQESRQKMCEVKKKMEEWKKIKVSRREEIVLNRLRSGHTYLTQGYLMEREVVQERPIWYYCNNALMTVKHLLQVCPALDGDRRRYRVYRESGDVTMKTLLNESGNIREVLHMLKRLDAFGKI